MLYPIVLTFKLKPGSTEKFSEAVRMIKQLSVKYHDLAYVDAFIPDNNFKIPNKEETPESEWNFRIIFAWKVWESSKQFMDDTEMKRLVFPILDEIQTAHDVERWISVE